MSDGSAIEPPDPGRALSASDGLRLIAPTSAAISALGQGVLSLVKGDADRAVAAIQLALDALEQLRAVAADFADVDMSAYER